MRPPFLGTPLVPSRIIVITIVIVIVIIIIIMIIVIVIIIIIIILVGLRSSAAAAFHRLPANLRTKILDFGGFDSSRILIVREGIPRSIGNFPGILSQRILVGVMLVGRLGVMDTQLNGYSPPGKVH